MLLTDTETGTGHTVSDGTEPCELRLVDGEVRAAWTLETLLVENLDRVLWSDRLGLHSSANRRL